MSSIPNSYVDDIRRISQSALNQLEHLKVRWLTGVERINNAEWSDVNYGVTVCTSTTRPTAYIGRVIYETDTGKKLAYNGVSWIWDDLSAQVTRPIYAVSDNTPTILPFLSELWDTDNIHDNTTNYSRLTCKTPGRYLIMASGRFDTGPAGERRMRILQTDPSIPATWPIADITRTTVAANGTDLHLQQIIWMDLNEYVELEVTQKSGGTLNFLHINALMPRFTMQKQNG